MSESAQSMPPPRQRLVCGAGVFLLGQLSPLLIPLVADSALSPLWKTTLSGFLLLGIPELAILLSVAILGKSGFQFLKSRIFRVLRRTVIPKQISRGRHRIGLAVFLLPISWGWAFPYLHEILPMTAESRIWAAVTGDLLLILGLILLGGGFWDKLRQLFTYGPVLRSKRSAE